jgi:hypothetical protein
VEILRRVKLKGCAGGKTALYGLIRTLRPKTIRPIVRFEGLAGEFSQHDFGQVDVTFLDGAEKRVHFFASRLKYSRRVDVTNVPDECAETLDVYRSGRVDCRRGRLSLPTAPMPRICSSMSSTIAIGRSAPCSSRRTRRSQGSDPMALAASLRIAAPGAVRHPALSGKQRILAQMAHAGSSGNKGHEKIRTADLATVV